MSHVITYTSVNRASPECYITILIRSNERPTFEQNPPSALGRKEKGILLLYTLEGHLVAIASGLVLETTAVVKHCDTGGPTTVLVLTIVWIVDSTTLVRQEHQKERPYMRQCRVSVVHTALRGECQVIFPYEPVSFWDWPSRIVLSIAASSQYFGGV